MKCEQHLAIEAIIVGLRRSGVIDRRAVQTIAEALEETATKARQHCPNTADSLHDLAAGLVSGPGRTCSTSVAA